MPLTVRPLSHALGAEIADVDLAKPLTDRSVLNAIHRAEGADAAAKVVKATQGAAA